MIETSLRISIDMDDCLNYWYDIYFERFGRNKKDHEITHDVWNILRKDYDFWINLPIKNYPDFIPASYCTSRVIKKKWIKDYIKKHGLPNSPVYQVFGFGRSKAPMLKGKCDVMIDDSPKNFIDLNNKGIPCLLMDSPYNRSFDTPMRVYSLHYEEIVNIYNEFFSR